MTQAGKAVIDQQEGTEAGASGDGLGAPISLSALCEERTYSPPASGRWYCLRQSCALRGAARRTSLPCPVWTGQQTPPAVCASGGAAPMHWGLGGHRSPTSYAGYIPGHCLLLLSTPIKEGCKLSAMMVYFAHANSTNKNSDSAVSGKKCRNEILDKIYHRFYSVDAPVCFRLF